MASTMRSRLFIIFLICVCINITLADPWRLHIQRRDDTTISSTTVADAATTQSGQTSQTTSNARTTSTDQSGSSTPTPTASVNSTSTIATSKSSSTTTSASALFSNLNGASPTSALTYSGFNSTLTPNELPITPRMTPSFAVAGVILMVTGLGYTLVGMKNKWLHISISAGYLSSLAVLVLIIYVMNPPISDAIQGAYLVAIVLTGLILGAASLVFTEMTEGLGCLLGGFCFSMWLLVLKPGGLLTATSDKCILIAVFTMAIFSTSFSHHTRPYGLIVSISFGGATALVLGIDCFSRAGLKEFWAYLWNLNDTLFPLGATTYPLTRGIKVEIAAIVIIFLAGVVSQMKLWKIIKESREQRAAERLEDERTMAQEEENVGRTIEHANAKERDQWEAVYGDKDIPRSSAASIRDSGVGDMDSQKKGSTSTVVSLRRSNDDEIELSDMPSPTLSTGAGLVMRNQGKDGGPITVRVARDLAPTPEIHENGTPTESKRFSHISRPTEEEPAWVVGSDGEARLERRASQRSNKRISSAPKVVPLPFKVPHGDHDDDRSSVATFAPEDEQTAHRRGSRHLSASIDLMRKISKRSPRDSKRFSMQQGQSTEDLVVAQDGIEDDRASSIAATMDGLSDDDDDMRSIRSSINQAPDTTEATRIPEITTTGPDSAPDAGSVEVGQKSRPHSTATVATTILDTESTKQEAAKEETSAPQEPMPSLTSSTDLKPREAAVAKDGLSDGAQEEKGTPSATSAVESKRASITKERLPPQVSKVVRSYRTNEWAKHLSQADTPEFEEIKLAEYPVETEPAVAERAAPVNVEELQHTATNAAPLQVQRTRSQVSNYSSAPQKSSPELDLPSNQDASIVRSVSQQSQSSTPRTMTIRTASGPHIPQQIVESPIEDQFPNTSPAMNSTSKFTSANVPYGAPNTLMGRRDSMLRNKAAQFSHNSPAPHSSQFQSQFVSQYNSNNTSRVGSDAGSIYNYPGTSTPVREDDDMSLSQRRNLIRQSSLHNTSPYVQPLQQTPVPFDSHQPMRQSTVPPPLVRDQQLASWRASVQADFQNQMFPQTTIERQRSALWQERQAEEQRRALEERMRGARDVAFDERMRRGNMLDAHKEALRKMQASVRHT